LLQAIQNLSELSEDEAKELIKMFNAADEEELAERHYSNDQYELAIHVAKTLGLFEAAYQPARCVIFVLLLIEIV
jgi:hypothetical protein